MIRKSLPNQFIVLLVAGGILFFSAQANCQLKKQYLSFDKGILKSQTESDEFKVNIEQDKNAPTSYSVKLSGALLYEVPFKSDTLHQIYIERLSAFGESGQPALPAKNLLISIPDHNPPEIEITALDSLIINNISILPNLPPEADVQQALQQYYPNPHYQVNAFYPEKWVEVIDVQKTKGQSIAIVQVHPVRFNPVTRQIMVATNLQFSVKTASLKKNQIPSSTQPTYLIIAPEIFKDAANRLLKWKQKNGFKTQLKLSDTWTPEQIKTTVKSVYADNGNNLDYLLLLGDYELIPAEEFYRADDGETKLYVTDLYYACLDDEDDYMPDMAYGRLPVSNVEEANSSISKLIDFTINPPSSNEYYKNVIGCAQYQDDNGDGYADRRFIQTSEDVGDYLKTKGYNYQRIYVTGADVTPQYYNDGKYSSGGSIPTDLLRSNGFKWDGDATQIINKINQGAFFTFHRDHGKTSGLGWSSPEFTTEHVAQLNNPEVPTFLYSINCHSGKFNLPESFAEAMLLHPKGGAIAAFCATNTSFSGYNDAMFIAMVDAIWNNPGIVPDLGPDNPTSQKTHEPITTLGEILNFGKLRMLEQWTGSIDTHQHIFELFHLFGDPSMPMPIQQPAQIEANAPDWFSDSEYNLTINSTNCQDGYVTLSTNQVFYSGNMENGTISLTINPLEDDSLQLMIYQQGYVPYIKTIKKAQPLLQIPDVINLGTLDKSTFPINGSFDALNSGQGTLSIDNITSSNSGLQVLTSVNQNIAEGELVSITWKLTDDSPGINSDTIRLFENDKIHQVVLRYTTATKVLQNQTEGLWSIANSPYLLSVPVTIQTDKSLIIDAGVEILFETEGQLIVNGSIDAIGTEEMPVYFRAVDESDNSGLLLKAGGERTSRFEYCHFENFQNNSSKAGAIEINQYSNVEFKHCQFSNNYSTGGGAIMIDNSNPDLLNCSFSFNGASYGGAVYINEAQPTFTNCIFHHNKSTLYGGSGGAIYAKVSDPLIEGCLFHDNYAAYAGAVYLLKQSKGLLVNNTFSKNLSNYGAALRLKEESHPDIYNTIFWDDEAFSGGKEIYVYNDCKPIFTNCILKGGKNDIRVYNDGLFIGKLNDCMQVSPDFMKMKPEDYTIPAGSIAKDGGMENIPDYSFPSTDLQGGVRIRHNMVDIGAYEFQNHAPSAIKLSNDSLLRNMGSDRYIGTLTTTDVDVDDKHKYTIMNEIGQHYFTIRHDSLFTRRPTNEIDGNSIQLNLKTTDNGFGELSYDGEATLNISNYKTMQVQSLSPIKTTNYPKDTIINLDEYFIAFNPDVTIQYQTGESSQSRVASITQDNSKLHVSFKDVGVTIVPLTTIYDNEITNYEIRFEVWGPNAIEDINDELFIIYPNPVRQRLFFKTDKPLISPNARIDIYTISGQKILISNLFGEHWYKKGIDVSELKSGTYILKISSENQIIYQRAFIKQ